MVGGHLARPAMPAAHSPMDTAGRTRRSNSPSGSRRQPGGDGTGEPDEKDVDQRTTDPKPAKTSAAAAIALALGVAALVLVLTVLLSPVALVLGIVLGIVGIKMAKKVGVTGKGVAITGLVLSVISVLLASTLAIGLTTFLNNEGAVNRLERQVENLKDKLPDDVQVPTP